MMDPRSIRILMINMVNKNAVENLICLQSFLAHLQDSVSFSLYKKILDVASRLTISKCQNVKKILKSLVPAKLSFRKRWFHIQWVHFNGHIFYFICHLLFSLKHLADLLFFYRLIVTVKLR